MNPVAALFKLYPVLDELRRAWEFFMQLRGATTDERPNDSPLGRGKGLQALGWVVD